MCLRYATPFLVLTASLLQVAVHPWLVLAEDRVSLAVHPQGVSRRENVLRLLPADPELTDGNAAVVLLRMTWEQRTFMQEGVPKIYELYKLPFDDARLQEFSYGHFQKQMRRAALMREANWMYPLNEQPLAMILLPDVQGLRTFARGQTIWVKQKIASKDYPAAIDGIMVQLACARHIARTPLRVNHLVASAIADSGLDNCETLIEQPGCANLYWALAMLPDSLGDLQSAIEWESQILERSLPSLQLGRPEFENAEAWARIAEEFSDFMLHGGVKPMSRTDGNALRSRMMKEAHSYLQTQLRVPDDEVGKMSEQAIVMRWVLELNDRVNSKIEAAYSLPSPLAIQRLLDLQAEIKLTTDRVQSPASPFPDNPISSYLALHRFVRRVKLMQAVESIRDFAANNSSLPESLDNLTLPAPKDPLTERPFEYDVSAGKATLRMPSIPGIEEPMQRQRIYELTLIQSE